MTSKYGTNDSESWTGTASVISKQNGMETSVPNINIVDTATYKTWSTTNKGTQAAGSVAYCFNRNKHNPYNQVDGTWYKDDSTNKTSGAYNY
jgi:hypothetical protein